MIVSLVAMTLSRPNMLLKAQTRHSRSVTMLGSFFSSKPVKESPIIINKVVITGATGLLGTELTKSLEKRSIEVIRLTRKPSREGDVAWDPSTGLLDDISQLEGIDAVISLAGENVGSGEGPLAFLGRWSEAKKASILDSRVNANKLLIESFSKLKKKPKVFVTASAIGFYGYLDQTTLFDESSPKGKGFLSEVCQNIEIEAIQAQKLGIRTVLARFAVILSPRGGVLGKLLLPFFLSAGGIIGSGKQGFSWVTIKDAVKAIEFLLESPTLVGPVNVAAPNPVDNAEFTSALGK